MRWREQHGFTLLEVLLSVGLLTALAGISLPVYASFQVRNDLEITTKTTASMLRRAQTYSRNGHRDSQWGVAIQGQQITLYKGADYASRDTSLDETTQVSSAITLSGLSEITFTRLEARPSASGTITLTAGPTNKTVSINAYGMVDYQ